MPAMRRHWVIIAALGLSATLFGGVGQAGFGGDSRPAPMNDPCNLAPEQQTAFIPSVIPDTCAPTYPRQMTSIQSDWDDVGAVVDYLRALRHVDRVSLVAWSLGGPRAGGYASQHPEKGHKLGLLAPAHNRGAAPAPPAAPAARAPFHTHSRQKIFRDWGRQVGCPAQ